MPRSAIKPAIFRLAANYATACPHIQTLRNKAVLPCLHLWWRTFCNTASEFRHDYPLEIAAAVTLQRNKSALHKTPNLWFLPVETCWRHLTSALEQSAERLESEGLQVRTSFGSETANHTRQINAKMRRKWKVSSSIICLSEERRASIIRTEE